MSSDGYDYEHGGGGHHHHHQQHQQVHRVDFQRRAIEIAEGDSKLRQVFVGGVSMFASEEDLMRVFEPCGTVVALRWGTDRRTHKFKGFVHIEFASADAVPKAVGASGTDVKGRNIRVSAARGPSSGGKRQHVVAAEKTDSPSLPFVPNTNNNSSNATSTTSTEVCLRCRQPGHRMANCPKVGGSGVEGGRKATVMCYNCGGNSHRASRCRKPKLGNGFTHAKCFICGETGHLSSQCEHNDKGLYPKGGGCRFCGSNRHLKKDCPDRAGNKKKTQEAKATTKGEGGKAENDSGGAVLTWQGSTEGHVGAGQEAEFEDEQQHALDGENFAIESMRGAEVELDATVGKKRKKKKKKKDKRKHKKAKKTTFE